MPTSENVSESLGDERYEPVDDPNDSADDITTLESERVEKRVRDEDEDEKPRTPKKRLTKKARTSTEAPTETPVKTKKPDDEVTEKQDKPTFRGGELDMGIRFLGGSSDGNEKERRAQ